MDKEKEIQDIANILSQCDNPEGDCYQECDCSVCRAEALDNAGYRKADEVRKETAKEIFESLWNLFKTDSCSRTIKEQAELYGVKVDE